MFSSAPFIIGQILSDTNRRRVSDKSEEEEGRTGKNFLDFFQIFPLPVNLSMSAALQWLRPMASPFDGIIMIAHGARDARWMEPFFRVRDDLAKRLSPVAVALAFLDFAPPKFAEGVAELYKGGARRILVVPVFLSGGGHVAKDVPELVDAERARYPDATFAVSGAIGEEREVITGMMDAVLRLAKK
jgi:sirohydrochlorin cobaltochelatase